MSVAGSAFKPKFHDHVIPVDVPVLVKSTGAPVHFGAVDLKVATGVELMVIVCVVVWVQLPSEIVNVMVFVPELLYNTPDGFSADEVAGIAS